MNKEISKVLRDRLRENGGLPFIQKYAGLVQTVTDINSTSDNTTEKKRYPVSTETVVNDVCHGNEEIMTPDSSMKGILYFEDGGTQKIESEKGRFKYVSTLTLIVWINRQLITSNIYSEITGIAIQMVLKKLRVEENPENVGMFNKIQVSLNRILPQEATLFSKYTYDETVTQYLRPPFEFFGLSLSVKYGINDNCINDFNFENIDLC
jgi:hypothetical protein